MGFNEKEVSNYFDDTSFDRKSVSDFLDEDPVSTQGVSSFLDGKTVTQEDPITGMIGGEPTTGDPSLPLEDMAPTPVFDRPTPPPPAGASLEKGMGDMASAFNRNITSLPGIVGDQLNRYIEDAVAEPEIADLIGPKFLQTLTTLPIKAGAIIMREMGGNPEPLKVPGSKELGELTDWAGVTYKGDEDSAAGQAGKYMAMGLEFLYPVLKMGKMAGQYKNNLAGTADEFSPDMVKGLSERVTLPFFTGGKTAYVGELGASAMSGAASKIVGDEFGPEWGTAAGMIVPIPTQTGTSMLSRAPAALKKTLLPYTSIGARVKAQEALVDTAEKSAKDTLDTIAKNELTTLPEARLSAAKLADDAHLIAMQREVASRDSKLFHKFELEDQRVSEIARKEMDDMGGDIPIEKTQTWIKARVARVQDVLNAQLDHAFKKANDAMLDLPTQTNRANVQTEVSDAVFAALKESRKHETKMWEKVDETLSSPLLNTQDYLKDYLSKRAVMADKAEMPDWIMNGFGRLLKNGEFKVGRLGNETSVKEVHTARTRINNLINEEKSKDAVNWNKVRILDDLQEAMLKDLSASPAAKEFQEALGTSRVLNQKFRGGVMDVILGHDRTGGKLAPEVSIESVLPGSSPKTGAQSAVKIKQIIESNPETAPLMETFVKMGLYSSSAINKKDGGMKINTEQAKKWMRNNEEALNIFPKLRKQMNVAIGRQQQAESMQTTVKERLSKIKGSQSEKLANSSPDTFLGKILNSQNSARVMEKQFNQSNAVGKRAIKGDIVSYLLDKAKAPGKVDSNGSPMLSGVNFQTAWNKNKAVFKKALSPGEIDRLEMIMNTLRLNDGPNKIPTIDNIIKPGNKIITYIITMAAASKAGKMVKGGGQLKAASTASSRAKELVQSLDVGAANKLMADAVQDNALFKDLFADISKPMQANRAWKTLQAWMVVNLVESMQEKEDGN